LTIWGLCNRKGGNCWKKSNLYLYAKYDFQIEINSELILTQKIFFLVVSPLFIAKAPYCSSGILQDLGQPQNFPKHMRPHMTAQTGSYYNAHFHHKGTNSSSPNRA